MPKVLLIISKKLVLIIIVVLFAVSMALFISPGKIYGAGLVTKITVTGAGGASTVACGGTLQMSAAVLPIDATNQIVTWSVAPNTGSASINNSGLLTGIETGTVYVFATSTDGSGKSGYLIITIAAPILVTSITVTGAASAITVLNGATLQMSAEVLPVDATNSTITWSVTNGTGSASINSAGLLTGTGTGTVSVKATASDSSAVTNTLEITVTAPPPSPSPPAPPSPAPSPSALSASSSALSFFSSAVYEKTATGFVTLFYNRILGRAPDAEGQNGWVSGLAGGALSSSDLVRGFIFSEENKLITSGDTDEQFLTSLYRLVFDRVPDAGGLKSWLASMSAGMTRDEVIGYFTSCTEFISLCSKYGVRP